jgi:hypothetical protein
MKSTQKYEEKMREIKKDKNKEEEICLFCSFI